MTLPPSSQSSPRDACPDNSNRSTNTIIVASNTLSSYANGHITFANIHFEANIATASLHATPPQCPAGRLALKGLRSLFLVCADRITTSQEQVIDEIQLQTTFGAKMTPASLRCSIECTMRKSQATN